MLQSKPTALAGEDAVDPFYAPITLPAMLADWKLFEGTPLTPEEEEAWQEYREATEEAGRRRDRLGLVDLAEVMDGGGTAPVVLEEDLLVEGEHHVVYGTKESTKTWRLLIAAAHQVVKGQDVVWIDKEMGRKNVADRMLTIGVPSDAIAEHFTYMEYPMLDGSPDSRVLFGALLAARRPVLMVVDAHTEVLADAALNENRGTDVARWEGWYLTPARRLGVATVMLDHVSFADAGKPVASRQKGASAKIEWQVVKKDKLDRNTAGTVEFVMTKNTISAPFDVKQLYRMGGDGEGHFVCERMGPIAALLAKGGGDTALADRIEEVLREHGSLSQRTLTGLVTGRAAKVTDAAKRLADASWSNVESRVEMRRGNATIVYEWVVPAVVPEGEPEAPTGSTQPSGSR
jgi:hypothetical protein